MDKRTSPRAIYDHFIRWIAAHGDTKAQPGLGLMVADVFDVDPMAVARHVSRVKDGSAPPMFHMPTSESARRAREANALACAETERRLEDAGVRVGSRWWTAGGKCLVVVTGVRVRGGDPGIAVECPQERWTSEYKPDYFLKWFVRVLTVEVTRVGAE